MKEYFQGWAKLPLGEWTTFLVSSVKSSGHRWTHKAVVTESGFLGSTPADNSLGAPVVLSSGNLERDLCQWDACACARGWVACRVCWDQGLQTGFSFLSFFWEALGFEGWVRVWGFGLDHRLVNFML